MAESHSREGSSDRKSLQKLWSQEVIYSQQRMPSIQGACLLHLTVLSRTSGISRDEKKCYLKSVWKNPGQGNLFKCLNSSKVNRMLYFANLNLQQNKEGSTLLSDHPGFEHTTSACSEVLAKNMQRCSQS